MFQKVCCMLVLVYFCASLTISFIVSCSKHRSAHCSKLNVNYISDVCWATYNFYWFSCVLPLGRHPPQTLIVASITPIFLLLFCKLEFFTGSLTFGRHPSNSFITLRIIFFTEYQSMLQEFSIVLVYNFSQTDRVLTLCRHLPQNLFTTLYTIIVYILLHITSNHFKFRSMFTFMDNYNQLNTYKYIFTVNGH